MANHDWRKAQRGLEGRIQRWVRQRQPQLVRVPPRGQERGAESTTGGYLGPISTVADSERRGVLGALKRDEGMLLILTNSMAAKSTAINLARGAAPIFFFFKTLYVHGVPVRGSKVRCLKTGGFRFGSVNRPSPPRAIYKCQSLNSELQKAERAQNVTYLTVIRRTTGNRRSSEMQLFNC